MYETLCSHFWKRNQPNQSQLTQHCRNSIFRKVTHGPSLWNQSCNSALPRQTISIHRMRSQPVLTVGALLATSAHAAILGKHITCLEPGTGATAEWTQANGLICQYGDLVGSNFDKPPKTRGGRKSYDHNCMGRCGRGCHGHPKWNSYTQDCFNHDMCTYFNDVDVDKKHGTDNPDCAGEYKHGVGDVLWARWKCNKKNHHNLLEDSPHKIPGYPLCHWPGKPHEEFYVDFGREFPVEGHNETVTMITDVGSGPVTSTSVDSTYTPQPSIRTDVLDNGFSTFSTTYAIPTSTLSAMSPPTPSL